MTRVTILNLVRAYYIIYDFFPHIVRCNMYLRSCYQITNKKKSGICGRQKAKLGCRRVLDPTWYQDFLYTLYNIEPVFFLFGLVFPPLQSTNQIIPILGVFQLSTVCDIDPENVFLLYTTAWFSVTVELAGVFSLQDLMGWSQSDRSFFNRQDVMTRGGKGGAESNTHKKSPSQWLKEEYEKAKLEREKIKVVFGQCPMHVLRISSLHTGTLMDGSGDLVGGQAAEELECGGGCWLAAWRHLVYLFCFVSCLIKIKDGEKSSANKST